MTEPGNSNNPLLAARDEVVETIRQFEAGKKIAKNQSDKWWSHATLVHGRQWCSCWSSRTPRGQKQMYFDSSTSIDTPGEVARPEVARADYMVRMIKTLKIPGVQVD